MGKFAVSFKRCNNNSYLFHSLQPVVVVVFWRARLRQERKGFLCRCKCLCIQHESTNWDGLCNVTYWRRTAILRGHLSHAKTIAGQRQNLYVGNHLNIPSIFPVPWIKPATSRSTAWSVPPTELIQPRRRRFTYSGSSKPLIRRSFYFCRSQKRTLDRRFGSIVP